MQRTSFGIAGPDAAARFDPSPAALSGFVVLQLLIYASLPVPAGVLLGRVGHSAWSGPRNAARRGR